MFNITKFEFSFENFEQSLNIEVKDKIKTEIKVYLNPEDEKSKVIKCCLNSDINEDELLNVGSLLAKEIDGNFNVKILGETAINLSKMIENLLLGLTPTNYYSRNYHNPKVYKVNAPYDFEIEYQNAYKRAYSYNIARVLNNLPHNKCNPDDMVNFTNLLLTSSDINISVYRKEECESLKLNGILNVSKASYYEPAVIKIEYKTDLNQKPIALVGKGITFDSGGYNMKNGIDMQSMKTDMTGASAVLATIHYLSSIHAKANITGYLMISDNMISNNSLVPGDIITYSNNLSVEVINTDAEGRLVLADGILLAKKEGAKEIIDIASLTGNTIEALGPKYASLYTSNELLAKKMIEQNCKSNEKVWHMPLISEYKNSLKGNISDLKNLSSFPYAGSITAALFLENFAKDVDWIHIDMNEQTSNFNRGSNLNCYGVRLLTNYILG